MGKYLVKQTQTTIYSYMVEAKDEDEAQELVENDEAGDVIDSQILEDEITVEAQ